MKNNRIVDPRENGCLCQRCGTRYKVDILIDDNLWGKISKGKNLLCGQCIIKELELLGFSAYRLEELK